MTDWLAWVDVLEDARDLQGPRVRMYVTHGIPFLQLTPFRSAGARYATCEAARTIAAIAAASASPSGTEQAPPGLSPATRGRPGASAPRTSGLG
jgi:hypothetical protein